MICTIKILDQVNVKLEGLTPSLLAQCKNALKFFIPSARHTPAFKLGRWDGTKAFMTGNRTYLNLLDRILPIIIDNGYEIEIDDHRPPFDMEFLPIDESYLANRVWPEGHPAAGTPIQLRDYQVNAINAFLKDPQSIQELSTSAGKTILAASLSSIFESKGRTIIIVPSKMLVKQTAADYKNIGLDTGIFYGDEKVYNAKHTICTWQSLSILAERTRQGDTTYTFDNFVKDVCAVITDECHQAKAQIIHQLLTGPFKDVPIRLGLSGTIPKVDYEFFNLLSAIGPVVGGVKAKDLIDKGVLSTLHINMIELNDSHVEFGNWNEESNYLNTDQRRLNWFAHFCEEKAKTGNTLVLVKNKETGKYLQSISNTEAIYINGDVDLASRMEEYDKFRHENNFLLFASFGTTATGISITRINNLILFNCGQSFTQTIQSIGRGLRKGGDKTHINVFDVYSNLKFSKKHSSKRKEFYRDAGYPFDIKKIKYR